MKCDNCGSYQLMTIDSRKDCRLRPKTIRRRRVCKPCGNRFTTYEITLDDLIKLENMK